jgi:transposase InsO family protein
VDHASNYIFHRAQFSTTANETLTSKLALEQHANEHSISIKKYHTNNGVFALQAFRTACASQNQQLSFSGVGAHHQNGIAERNIKTRENWGNVPI